MIHPTAIIDPAARLAADVTVGPYTVIDGGVQVGAGCVIGPHVYLTGSTVLGERNQVLAGAVLGEAPQDLHYLGQPTELRIGNDNVFREHVTVHRSSKPGDATVIGSHNLLMAGSHVAHNCRLGDRIILANGALLGGHVRVAHGAFISGNCLVHQFVRVGSLALMQGGSRISKDLPPFTVVRGRNRLCGLNIVGLRRAGLAPDERLELRQLYHLLFRSGLRLKDALAQATTQFQSPRCVEMIQFLGESKRGFCRGIGRRTIEEERDED